MPSPARVWNYWVGGTDNFAADRAVGEQVRAAMPFMPMLARYTRRFLAGARPILDFSQPVAVLFMAVLHFIPDADDPDRVVRRVLAAVPPGSFLVVGHAAGDIQADVIGPAMDLYNQRSATPIWLRTRAEVARFFDGLDLVEPGLVPLGEWFGPGGVEPGAAGLLSGYAGVARKP